ncbi:MULTISPECIES: S66 peptidase family protein [unclassified Endozoicomonas]|uniref:S66 peptidase family protein n=1 Tax=unclassified Endozoicomonas TaxID=2644528 RepID=UPI003BB735AB
MKKLLFIILCWLMTSPVLALPAIKPAPLNKGDTVALISSGFRVNTAQDVQFATERLEALGLSVIYGKTIFQQTGYFAGTDQARAADINDMFANPKVKAIIELRGGWGSARILEYLDFPLIKKHPKIFMGFSDITTLLLAIHQKTGLITFHGPMAAAYPWTQYTVNYLKKILFEGNAITMSNPIIKSDDLTRTVARIQTIRPGIATGEILGGNLSVLVSMLGSPYLPSFKNKILFLEDTGEDVYQIDRMLTQLQTVGILKEISGFIFGQCINCNAKVPYGSYRLQEVLKQHISPLNIPAWNGAMIGHQASIFTIGEGVKVRIDASKGTMTMLEPAVNP